MDLNKAFPLLLLLTSGVSPCCTPASAADLPAPSARTLPPKPLILEEPPRLIAGPPLSLTSSDGTGLELVGLKARAVLEDPLAFTELHLSFRNPEQRIIEGQFEITLPEGAVVSRFAMRQDSGWQEGEVVELQAAREAYEDFLHRRQDPALLEKQAGNQFRARVFPIPAGGVKELILSYTQERSQAAAPYRLYLKGLPRVAQLDLRALVSKAEVKGGASSLGGSQVSHQVVEVKKQNFKPDDDFVVPLPQAADRNGLRHDNLVVGRITPLGADTPDPVDGLVILFDTSASRALGFKEQVERLPALVGAIMKGTAPLKLVAFDQDVETIYQGPASGFGPSSVQKLLDRQALGASDLGRALQAVVTRDKGGPLPRVLLLSDGIPTAGKTEGNELRAIAKDLKGAGVQRLDAVTFGGIRDEDLLKRLSTAGLVKNGVVLDGDLPVSALSRRITHATISGLKVSVPGAAWSWPTQLDGVQQGDQVLVYADLPRGKKFDVVLGGGQSTTTTVSINTQEVPRPLIERAWVAARIRKLSHQRDTMAEADQDMREGLKQQIIQLSTKHRVLSDYTGLLILETEADYARFKIDRRALSDILTVGPSGIEVIDRKNRPLVFARPIPQPEEVEGGALDEADSDGNFIAQPRRAQTGGKAEERRNRPATETAKKSAAPAKARAKNDAAEGFSGGGAAAGPRAGAAAPPAMAPPRPEPPAAKPAPSRPRSFDREAKESVAASEARRSPPRDDRPAPPPPPPPRRAMEVERPITRPPTTDQLMIARNKEPEVSPYEGKLAKVMGLLKEQKAAEALAAAQNWRKEDPGDVLALIALGETYESQGQRRKASRAYGSLIDLFPGRADLRRFAGERLERLLADGLSLAQDTFEKAQAQRPDHPSSHRLLAYALVRAGKEAEAFAVIEQALTRHYPSGRFSGVDRILREDAGLIAAAWLRKEPGKQEEVLRRLAALSSDLPRTRSLRFVLNWETDANDVDFHIYDGQGGHAYYSSRQLPSGGELYADVTTGYGPECFTIQNPGRAYPYKLQAHYYSRGPMGYGMGKLEIIEHDGKGGLKFQERPFVIMKDRAFVDLGQVKGPLP